MAWPVSKVKDIRWVYWFIMAVAGAGGAVAVGKRLYRTIFPKDKKDPKAYESEEVFHVAVADGPEEMHHILVGDGEVKLEEIPEQYPTIKAKEELGKNDNEDVHNTTAKEENASWNDHNSLEASHLFNNPIFLQQIREMIEIEKQQDNDREPYRRQYYDPDFSEDENEGLKNGDDKVAEKESSSNQAVDEVPDVFETEEYTDIELERDTIKVYNNESNLEILTTVLESAEDINENKDEELEDNEDKESGSNQGVDGLFNNVTEPKQYKDEGLAHDTTADNNESNSKILPTVAESTEDILEEIENEEIENEEIENEDKNEEIGDKNEEIEDKNEEIKDKKDEIKDKEEELEDSYNKAEEKESSSNQGFDGAPNDVTETDQYKVEQELAGDGEFPKVSNESNLEILNIVAESTEDIIEDKHDELEDSDNKPEEKESSSTQEVEGMLNDANEGESITERIESDENKKIIGNEESYSTHEEVPQDALSESEDTNTTESEELEHIEWDELEEGMVIGPYIVEAESSQSSSNQRVEEKPQDLIAKLEDITQDEKLEDNQDENGDTSLTQSEATDTAEGDFVTKSSKNKNKARKNRNSMKF